ncbi:MAG: pilus assembly protein PilO [Chromatiaceae bacterium]|nr:MAG: pilus assembly protein PilO [Chromatiaceae bacterium]
MEFSDFNELDLNNIGEWPTGIKAAVILFVCGLLGFGWYQFVTQAQIDRLQSLRGRETELKAAFEAKQAKAVNLEALRQQMEEMRKTFDTMLRQLPDRTEVAMLLMDVSQTGLAAGLEFELFQPTDEVNRNFYAELPITMRVSGRYHEFGRFISGLAALPRIVTVHNVSISPSGRGTGDPFARMSEPLQLEATVKTYRYLDDATVQ